MVVGYSYCIHKVWATCSATFSNSKYSLFIVQIFIVNSPKFRSEMFSENLLVIAVRTNKRHSANNEDPTRVKRNCNSSFGKIKVMNICIYYIFILCDEIAIIILL